MYRVVKNSSLNQLEKDVCGFRKRGWLPSGNVNKMEIGGKPMFVQAIYLNQIATEEKLKDESKDKVFNTEEADSIYVEFKRLIENHFLLKQELNKVLNSYGYKEELMSSKLYLKGELPVFSNKGFMLPLQIEEDLELVDDDTVYTSKDKHLIIAIFIISFRYKYISFRYKYSMPGIGLITIDKTINKILENHDIQTCKISDFLGNLKEGDKDEARNL